MGNFEYGQREMDHLRKRDKRLGKAIDRLGPLECKVTPDLFPTLISNIVGQQISGRAAETVWGRVKERFIEITPERLVDVPVESIQACGMSMRKATYVKGIAEACAKGELDLEGLKVLPDQEVVAQLCALRGIGTWTAEMMLIFSLQRQDVVSWNDLAIRRGMMALYELEELTRERFDAYRKRYSPYGSVASLYLWEISHERTGSRS
ncbi:MAG: DNA-3-methyladenine glycosylase [Methanomassiliicoccales archaeon]|nr:DNA-3-methyladenine glycosylase [Methanomassiliicoccales archaeon]